ncbi:MAG: MFS transporter [Akkermansiaceae bacterium]|nr:MFS transporter [Akkermansiaceae bacterium]MCF7732368.1 MFS transporter [Akkermansiaceae bacterium]
MAMTASNRLKLKTMMFLIFAFNGIWIIPLGTYLDSVGYSAANIGSAYMTFAIGCIVSPFFVGMVADRFFSAQKIMAVLILLAAGLLLLAARLSVGPDGLAHVNAAGEPVLGPFYWVLLAHFVCYMPTWALANSISFRQMENAGREFPRIRVWGTIGWIVVSMTTLFSVQINDLLGTSEPFEKSVIPLYFGAGIGLVTGLFCFFLPATPPQGAAGKVTFGDILGVKAFALFKDRGFTVFALTSFLILFPGMFYWAFANLYLNESGMKGAAAWQSTGQMTEMVFLFIMPWFFARFGVKKMLLLGLIAWVARFLCFSFGVWGTPTAMLVVLGLMLHGPCYDFFFVTGQLYTDKKAPREIRSQAQGFLFLITFGLGWLCGSYLAGWVVDHYALGKDAHAWSTIWLWPIGMVALIIAIFSIGFNDQTRVGDVADGSPETPPDS